MIHHLAHSLSGDKLCVKIYFQSPVVSVLVVPLITVVILSHIICIVRSVTVSQVSLGCRALQSHPCSPSAHRLLSLHICPLPPSLPPSLQPVNAGVRFLFVKAADSLSAELGLRPSLGGR